LAPTCLKTQVGANPKPQLGEEDMPLKPEPHDFEFIWHYPNADYALGVHPSAREDQCGRWTEEEHHDDNWRCSRQAGHMGRHEAKWTQDEDGRWKIVCSWANKPKVRLAA
jgi:hypothetical protein